MSSSDLTTLIGYPFVGFFCGCFVGTVVFFIATLFRSVFRLGVPFRNRDISDLV